MILLRVFNRCNKFFRKNKLICQKNYFYSTLSERKVEEIKIPVPWGHISGKWWGDKNKIPAIAIHGWQDNANSFDRLIPLLKLPSVLAIDLPGHGYSSHLPIGKTYDLQEFIVFLHHIITEQKWTKVPLITHSFGGNLGFIYSSLFSNNIKWLINFECARTLLSLYRYVTAKTFSQGIDYFLKIEQQKTKKVSPAYKLSELIKMTIEGSVGSVTTPQSALILLKRGAILADKSSIEVKREKTEIKSDLNDLIEFEKNMMKNLSKEVQENMKNYQDNIIKLVEKGRQNMQSYSLPEEEDKYYTLTRDASTKIKTFLGASDEFLIEASKNIKCPVLSLRASNGFLFGTGRKVYEQTLEILKMNSSLFEHHEINGTHHAHLNTPENLAPIINNFVEKYYFFFFAGKWWGSKNQRPILCLHGWQDNANSFDTLIPLLPPENSYLAIDLPGHGISSHFSKGVSYGFTEFIGTLRRVQNYYNWSKVSFIGHSLGASLGFLFSSFFQKDVDLLVAIDLLKPVSWVPETDFKKLQSSVNKALKNSARDQSTAPVYMEANLLKKCIEGSHNSLTKKSAEILMKRGTQEIQKGLLRLTRDHRLSTIPLHAFCQRELLLMSKVIETNVLFIKAKSSPFYEKKENIESIINSLKSSAKLFEYHTLPGTHHLHLNTPETVAIYINSFLDRMQYNQR